MRKLFLFLPVVALCFLCACTKEETTTNEPDDNTGGSTSSLVDPALAWSSSSVTAVLGSAVTFPTLTNKYNVSVTYSSSNTGVATITSDGTVTVIAAGAATITASSVATDTYSAGSASYTLTVTDGEDTGAGSYKYGSTGDTASDDDISNTTFTLRFLPRKTACWEASQTLRKTERSYNTWTEENERCRSSSVSQKKNTGS